MHNAISPLPPVSVYCFFQIIITVPADPSQSETGVSLPCFSNHYSILTPRTTLTHSGVWGNARQLWFAAPFRAYRLYYLLCRIYRAFTTRETTRTSWDCMSESKQRWRERAQESSPTSKSSASHDSRSKQWCFQFVWSFKLSTLPCQMYELKRTGLRSCKTKIDNAACISSLHCSCEKSRRNGAATAAGQLWACGPVC